MADRDEIERLKKKVVELEEELRDEKETFKMLETELDFGIEKLKKELKGEKSSRERTEAQFQQLRSLASSSEERVDKLTNENLGLKDTLQELSLRVRNLENEFDDLESVKRQNEVTIAELEERLSNSLEEVAMAQCEVEDLKDENRNLQEDLKESLSNVPEVNVGDDDIDMIKSDDLLHNQGLVRNQQKGVPPRENILYQLLLLQKIYAMSSSVYLPFFFGGRFLRYAITKI
eukprot:m.57833 g.57833  ORF g.57833 m.57833 type:complete len:232 (+) comp7838_c0_seq1:52-747(+)